MLANPSFDAELLRRYDRPDPRYTSYPTAPLRCSECDAFDSSAIFVRALAVHGFIIGVAVEHYPLGALLPLSG